MRLTPDQWRRKRWWCHAHHGSSLMLSCGTVPGRLCPTVIQTSHFLFSCASSTYALHYHYRQRRWSTFSSSANQTHGTNQTFTAAICAVVHCLLFQCGRLIIITTTTTTTSSSAVAKRPRDASCLSVGSFNSTKHWAQSFTVSYVGYRFITACN